MKRIILILTLFLLCFITNKKLNAEWYDCYDNWSFGCSSWSNWGAVIDQEVILDDFPTCTLTVVYYHRKCLDDPDKGLEQIYINDYSFTDQIGCASLYQYLHPGSQVNVDAVRNKLLKDKIFRNISESRFMEVKDDYPCLPRPTRMKKTYALWAGLCTAVCELEFTDGSIGYVTNDCVTDYCCGIIIEYCWNTQTNSEEKSEQHIGDQSMQCWILPAPPCPEEDEIIGGKTVSRLLSSSGCASTCEFE